LARISVASSYGDTDEIAAIFAELEAQGHEVRKGESFAAPGAELLLHIVDLVEAEAVTALFAFAVARVKSWHTAGHKYVAIYGPNGEILRELDLGKAGRDFWDSDDWKPPE
jgi:hypothetical protein